MDSAAREARRMARERDLDESRCPLVLLPPEMKHHIMSHISTQQSLSRLGQSCRAWYEVANEELYKRDSKENNSVAIKWMAAHAVDEQTTDSAIRTLEISLRWGGQIDAVKQHHYSRSDEEGVMYDTSTALYIAVFFGNVRLTKKLLDMKASPTIPCPVLFWASMGTQKLCDRFAYFQDVLEDWSNGPVFPIFVAFLQSDTDMCKLLIEHGASREAMIIDSNINPGAMSILHFAAADPTTDYRQWHFLFDKFREYINEPSPGYCQSTPLHVALRAGCTQGMQIVVEFGADKEARNGFSHTPLFSAVLEPTDYDLGIFEKRTVCIRKFFELGASLDSGVDSLLPVVVQSYISDPVNYPLTRQLISFLLEHRADIHGTGGWQNANMVNEILDMFFDRNYDTKVLELLKELLSDSVDRGLNFTTLPPESPSPLCLVLTEFDYSLNHEWLIHLLCANGAMIHEHEMNQAFHLWCDTKKMWETNEYDAWWQHQGQEDEMFQKWCEHPYNVWWWQYVNRISPNEIKQAYETAFGHEDRHLYDILTHLPLPAPSNDVLIELAFYSESMESWSWRVAVQLEFEDDFVATWSRHHGENMIHLTVHEFVGRKGGYSAADAIQDILYLRDKGVDVTSRNSAGKTPLESLLESGTSVGGYMELAALLEGNEYKAQELAPS